MKTGSEILLDENDISIIVDYRYDEEPQWEAEPGNPNTTVGAMVYTELKTVQLVIGLTRINILALLDDKTKQIIISKLQYDS